MSRKPARPNELLTHATSSKSVKCSYHIGVSKIISQYFTYLPARKDELDPQLLARVSLVMLMLGGSQEVAAFIFGLSDFAIHSTFVDFLRPTSQLGSTVTAFGAKDITSETLGMDPDLSGDAVGAWCVLLCCVDMIRLCHDERGVCVTCQVTGTCSPATSPLMSATISWPSFGVL